MQWWSELRPGELSTLPKTLSWMRERLRAEKGKMEHKGVKGNWGKYEMGRGGEGRRGERVRAQPPRGRTGGEVKEWVGRVG